MIKLADRGDIIIHMPIFVFDNSEQQKDRMKSELFVALYSYYNTFNTYPIVITTNDEDMYFKILEFKDKTKFLFDVYFVSTKECLDYFDIKDEDRKDPILLRYFISKFNILMRCNDCFVVHVDYDVMFMKRVDFRKIIKRGKMIIISDFYLGEYKRFTYSYYANTGVFSMDLSDNMKKFIKTYLMTFKDCLHEEDLINKVMARHGYKHEILEFSKLVEYNLLAYKRELLDTNERELEIVHFHWAKPFDIMKIGENRNQENVRLQEEDILFINSFQEFKKERLNNDFYLCSDLWINLFKEMNKKYFEN